MKSTALFTCVVFGLSLPAIAAPQKRAAEYLVSAAPLTIGAPAGDLCVAVNVADPRGVWWWEPGQSGCSTRSTGPGVFRGEGGSVSTASGAATEVRFRARLSDPWGVVSVLVLLERETMHSAATGSTVSIIRRKDLEVPGMIPEPEADRIPATITAALTAKFPKARIDKWSKEKEDGKVVYDIEFKQDGRKFEADIFADGTIHNWERQVAQADLPEPVVQALNRTFPNAALKEVMAVTEVKNGLEALQGYKIVVRRALRKDVEITIAPDGRVLEGPGAQK